MPFDVSIYGPEVAAILALEGNGERPMPLSEPKCTSGKALSVLKSAEPRRLFPNARAPEAALAGLYLYFGCWEQAHETAQNIHTPEGSYWHAIVHRQEPDAWNSEYWFRQVGRHAIFPALRDAAAGLGLDMGPEWRPGAFIELCERARSAAGSDIERQALAVQMAEWQLLFDYCARSA
jgi:hypothetical protein